MVPALVGEATAISMSVLKLATMAILASVVSDAAKVILA
jgi:hypothetical protein